MTRNVKNAIYVGACLVAAVLSYLLMAPKDASAWIAWGLTTLPFFLAMPVGWQANWVTGIKMCERRQMIRKIGILRGRKSKRGYHVGIRYLIDPTNGLFHATKDSSDRLFVELGSGEYTDPHMASIHWNPTETSGIVTALGATYFESETLRNAYDMTLVKRYE